MVAGHPDAPPALHGQQFSIKTADGDVVVVVDDTVSTLRLEDEQANELAIQLAGVTFTNHDHSEPGMAGVGGGAIADSSISTGKLQDDAVTTRKLADSAVSAGKVANNAVARRAVADSAVGAAELDQSEAYQFSSSIGVTDDQPVTYGSDDDMTGRFASAADALKWRDTISGADRMALARATGDLTLAGTLDETSSP